MLIRMSGGCVEGENTSYTGSYLDVADDLLGADWQPYKSVLSGWGGRNGPSPALPEDFLAFDLQDFVVRVSALATLI